ncbi:MAG: GNAT family N-acetyltransferase [Pseudomonadota bacterium]
MIRPGTPDDLDALAGLAAETGLFSAEDLCTFRGMMEATLAEPEETAGFWALDQTVGLRAGAYAAPQMMADGVWSIVFVGVRAAQRGRGHGAALTRHVEEQVQRLGARLLLVETSSDASLSAARAFCPRLGFEEEARIRDYYQDGEDKIVYRKAFS